MYYWKDLYFIKVEQKHDILFINQIIKPKKKIRKKVSRKIKRRIRRFLTFVFFKLTNNIFGFWLLNILLKEHSFELITEMLKSFKIVKYLLRLLRHFNTNLKKKLFFYHILLFV